MARKAIYKHATQVDANTYPDDGSSPVGTNEWNENPDQAGMYGNTPTTTTISIATGDLTVTDSVTVAAAQTGTTDTLDKLLITNTSEYDLIYLFAKTGQTITLTNTSSPSVSGHVKTISGSNEVLSTTVPTILIRKGNYWYGYGGGTTADGSITTAKLADNSVTSIKIVDGSILNADINAGAAIVYSKLSLASSIKNSDLLGSIANGKLATDPLARANHTGTQAHTTISDFDTGVQTNRLDQMAAATADIAVGSQKITGLANGSAATDAATKGQLDTAVASNITLKGGYDAANDNPHLDSGTRVTIAAGDHYVVTTAGTFYSEVLQSGDSLISTVASPTAFAQWIITNNNVVTPITNAQVAAGAAIDQSKIASLTTDLGLKAPKASPTFTGTATAAALTVTGALTATLTGTATNVTGTVAVATGGTNLTSYTAGDILYATGTTALAKLPKGTTEQTLKMNSGATAPEWVTVSSGGGAVDYSQINTNSSTTYEGSANGTRFNTLGQGIREIYIKKIDANNEGVFTKVFKNNTIVEVQIA